MRFTSSVPASLASASRPSPRSTLRAYPISRWRCSGPRTPEWHSHLSERMRAMSAEELKAKFGIAGVLDFANEGELVKAVVSRDGIQGELFLQGATVTSWAPAGQRPVIFTSPKAIYAPRTAIRGGVPIIFPWFGPHRTNPKAPQHGFVRAAPWQLDSVATDKVGEVTLALSCGQSE